MDHMDAVMDDTPVKPAGTPSLRLVDEQQSSDWQEPALDLEDQSRLRFGELNRHEQEDLAGILLSMMRELKELRVTAASLEEKPRKRGRKKADYKRKAVAMVSKLERSGMQRTKAYERVADEFNKAPDTIRRTYERLIAERSERRENDYRLLMELHKGCNGAGYRLADLMKTSSFKIVRKIPAVTDDLSCCFIYGRKA